MRKNKDPLKHLHVRITESQHKRLQVLDNSLPFNPGINYLIRIALDHYLNSQGVI
jgi:hypothetical protein